MDTARGDRTPVAASDTAVLAALKLRYGRKWRFWFVRGEWNTHRIGDFCQQDHDGAAIYAFHAPLLVTLGIFLEIETALDAERHARALTAARRGP